MAIAADAVKSKPNKQLQTENFLSSGCSERLSRLLRVREYTFLRSGFARFSVDGVAIYAAKLKWKPFQNSVASINHMTITYH
jgi:hypothetical protein